MTKQTFLKLINLIPSGEYYADPYEIYGLVCSKSYRNLNIWRNYSRRMDFIEMFWDMKYGLESLTHGKVRYIGTNDLNTIIIK